LSSIILTGDTSGTLTVSAPLVAGSNTVTLPAATGTVSLLTQATSVSASGTSVDFTGIPSWAKRITVMFSGVSVSGTSSFLIQLGSGSITNTGYASGSGTISASPSYSASTIGFNLTAVSAAEVNSGQYILNNISSNNWVGTGSINRTSNISHGVGSIALGGVLDRVRITTVNGTDTFDAGTINIIYEG
jgi:hypothetical protein